MTEEINNTIDEAVVEDIDDDIEEIEDVSDDEIIDVEEEVMDIEELFADSEEKKVKAEANIKVEPKKQTGYIGIQHVRYAAQDITASLNIVATQRYTDAELKNILLGAGYWEFESKQLSFNFHEPTGTLMINIFGSTKGSSPTIISESTLRIAAWHFHSEYATSKTEDRALVYRTSNQMFTRVFFPNAIKTSTSISNNVELTKYIDGLQYDLIADLHSHHVMACEFSKIDDEDETLRGILYGVAAWDPNEFEDYEPNPAIVSKTKWKFRMFDGTSYDYFSLEDIIGN